MVRYLLRGFDAIHLAAALDLQGTLGDDAVVFSSFDGKLLQAARASGLPCLIPEPDPIR